MSSICDNCKNIISCNNPRKSNPLLLSCQEQKTITNTEFAIVEFEKIKEEINETYKSNKYFGVEEFDTFMAIIDNRIEELKGENE